MAFVGVVFLAFYIPMVFDGWLGLDDEALILRNPHLGHGVLSLIWGWTDLAYGRRWTPLLWTVAAVVGQPSALGFHLLVLALALVVVLLVSSNCVASGGPVYGTLCALWFVLSPARCEVFGWEMGFVYCSVAICVLLAYLFRASASACCGLAFAAVLVYPVAAGACLVACFVHRRRWQGWALFVALCTIASLQIAVRHHMGFIPWHPRFDALPLVLPHYALVSVWPFASLPLFPAVFYPLLPLGLAVYIVAIVEAPLVVGVWTVLMLPVCLSAVTESFWYGSRYALLGDAWLSWNLAAWLRGRDLASRRALLGAAVVLVGGLNLSERWMWRGSRSIADGVWQESRLVGRDFRLDMRVRHLPLPDAKLGFLQCLGSGYPQAQDKKR